MAESYVQHSANVTPSTVGLMGGNIMHDSKFVARTLFYLVTPNETSFEDVSQVPNYFIRAMAYLPILLLIEIVILWIQGRKLPSYADTMCSMCCGLLIFLPVIVAGQMEIGLYEWCYENYRLVDLPWNSFGTWFLCLLAVDLSFYAWHRAAHEVNFVWSFHQVHHTSQEFNLSVGVRLPSLNRYVAMLFYLPCSLFFPTSVFYAHYQLNYIFQFWIHTATVPAMPFLDYFITTPSIHRVHHGRNRYCIDKNYGAVFTIWDIIFGTFERERPNEEIFYGLVHNVNSFNPIYIQIHHLKAIFINFVHQNGFVNKLSTLFKGPGWQPGKPRLGDINEIPEVPEDKELFNISLPLWIKIYLVIQYLLAFVIFFRIKSTKMLFSLPMVLLHGGYVLWAIASLGMFLDRRPNALILESIRSAFYFILEAALHNTLFSDTYVINAVRLVFAASFLVCAINSDLFKRDAVKHQKKSH